MNPASYLFLALWVGCFAKTEVTDDKAAPLPFATVFLGFLISRFDLIWPLAMWASVVALPS